MINEEGNLQFWGISDRGPNGDSCVYKVDGEAEASPSKIFPAPDFTPSIALITIRDGKAIVDEVITLKDAEGKEISGLPLAPGEIGATNEFSLSEDFEVLPYDKNGLDTEGIAVDADGNFWVCDEYGPFLVKFDSEGKELAKYAPSKGLPEILAERIPNRGAEGLTITPAGKLVMAMQSVLDVNGDTSKTALFTRVVVFNPETEDVQTFAYPVNTEEYSFTYTQDKSNPIIYVTANTEESELWILDIADALK